MQKVVGSSPIIRSIKPAGNGGFSRGAATAAFWAVIRLSLLSLLAAALSGCGTETSTSEPADDTGPRPRGETPPAPRYAPGECQRVGRSDTGLLRLCFAPRSAGAHGEFIVEADGTARTVPIAPPGPTPTASDAGKAGHWAWAALSPDRKTILAQWSAECEVPITFLVDAGGGTPTAVTGEADWASSPVSVALGWTTDNRALVFLPKGPACGSGAGEAGVYLYSDPGAGKLFLRAEGDRTPVEPSRRPRSAAALREAAS